MTLTVVRLLRVLDRAVNGRARGTPDVAQELVVQPDPDEVARQYSSTLLAEARDELTRADQKASILLAAAGVVIGAILAGMISAGWTPTAYSWPWNAVWIAGAASGLLGIAFLVKAVYPRTRRGRDDEAQLFYFRHAAAITSVDELTAELRRSSQRTFERSADQLWRVSQIVGMKYAAVRIGIWLLSAGAGLALLGVLGNSIWQ